MITSLMTRRIKRKTVVNDGQKIPKRIYQTQERADVPIAMRQLMEVIIKQNPEYSYHYFDDARCRKFVQKYFNDQVVETFDRLIPNSYRADFFRYCVLYMKGGVYIDPSILTYVGLKCIIPMDKDLVLVRDLGNNDIWPGFMACVPKHPLMKQAIEAVMSNVKSNYYGTSAAAPTGAQLLAELVQKQIPIPYNPLELTDRAQYLHVKHGTQIYFQIQYPTYKHDMRLYSSKPTANILWHQRHIYRA